MYVYFEEDQQAGAEPKTLCNGCVVVVPLERGWPAAEGAPALCVTGTEPAEQGSPLIEFLPIAGASIVLGSAGETGTGGGWVTVFPLKSDWWYFRLSSDYSYSARVQS